jgi:hypothetical protein
MRTNKLLLAASLLTLTTAAQARPFEDPRADRIPALDMAAANEPRDPGCVTDQLASTGGPMPKNPRTLAIRWTGYSNFELTYNGQIVLLDAYFDRGSLYPSLGF